MTRFLYTLEIPRECVDEVRIVREFPDVFQEIESLHPRRVGPKLHDASRRQTLYLLEHVWKLTNDPHLIHTLSRNL